jgi:hypothetical protein
VCIVVRLLCVCASRNCVGSYSSHRPACGHPPPPPLQLSANLREIFGGDGQFRLSWLLPTAPSYSVADWERMVGYAVGSGGSRNQDRDLELATSLSSSSLTTTTTAVGVPSSIGGAVATGAASGGGSVQWV